MTRAQRADAIQTAPVHAFYLRNVPEQNSANEMLTGLRLMLDPSVKLFLVPSQNMILMRGLSDDIALATSMLAEMDQAPKSYRLDFTLTELEGGKRLAEQHLQLNAEPGKRVTAKQGMKVPVATGKAESASNGSMQQIQYIDVGISADVTLHELAGGAQLMYKLERSALDGASLAKALDPVIRQVELSGTSSLVLGRPQLLETVDLPGGTRRVEVSATLEGMK